MFGSQRDPKWDWNPSWDPEWDPKNEALPEFPRWDPRLNPGWFSPVTSYSVRSATVSSVRDRGPELIAK